MIRNPVYLDLGVPISCFALLDMSSLVIFEAFQNEKTMGWGIQGTLKSGNFVLMNKRASNLRNPGYPHVTITAT